MPALVGPSLRGGPPGWSQSIVVSLRFPARVAHTDSTAGRPCMAVHSRLAMPCPAAPPPLHGHLNYASSSDPREQAVAHLIVGGNPASRAERRSVWSALREPCLEGPDPWLLPACPLCNSWLTSFCRQEVTAKEASGLCGRGQPMRPCIQRGSQRRGGAQQWGSPAARMPRPPCLSPVPAAPVAKASGGAGHLWLVGGRRQALLPRGAKAGPGWLPLTPSPGQAEGRLLSPSLSSLGRQSS